LQGDQAGFHGLAHFGLAALVAIGHGTQLFADGLRLEQELLNALEAEGYRAKDYNAREATAMGFTHAASAPLVRSSYHADLQAHGAGVT
jgi:hypothetical protein